MDALELIDLVRALGLPVAEFVANADEAVGPRPRAKRRR
jgi:hypothetical protein